MTILELFKKVDPSVLAAKMIFKYLHEKHPVLKISDIADTSSGGTPSRGMIEYYNGEIPWVKSGELKDGLITTCDEYITETGLKNSSAKLFPKGTLLVAMYGANIGKTGVLDFDATTNQAVCAIFPKIDISKDFLFWYFKQQRIEFIAIGKGGAQPNISQTIINNAPIVVPDKHTQKLIVDFLENIEHGKGIDESFFIPEVLKDVERIYKYKNSYVDLTDSFETQLTQLENLNQAILQEAVQGKLVVQDPADENASKLLKRIRNQKEKLIKDKKLKIGRSTEQTLSHIHNYVIPQNWVWCKTDEVFFVTKLAGFEYTEHIHLKTTGEIPVLRAQNIRPLNIDKSNLMYIDLKTSLLLNRCSLTKKCLLVTFIGAGIGDVATFEENERWHLAPNVAKMEPFDGCEELIDVKFVNYFLMSNIGQKEIYKHMKATAQPSLSMGTIRDIDIPLPPLIEQKRIVSEIERQFEKTKQLKEHIVANQQATEQLLKALLHGAFEVEEKKEETKTVPVIEFKPRICNLAERTVLAAYLIKQFNSKGFGRVMLMKLLYLIEHVCKLDFNSHYKIKVAGPYDDYLIKEIELTLNKYQFYHSIQDKCDKKQVHYLPLGGVNNIDELFDENFSTETTEINQFVSKFRSSTWDYCEIIATLYAVWNNRIIRNEVITDDFLKQDFLDWDPNKEKYRDRLNESLVWMRRKEIVPDGWGKLVERPES